MSEKLEKLQNQPSIHSEVDAFIEAFDKNPQKNPNQVINFLFDKKERLDPGNVNKLIDFFVSLPEAKDTPGTPERLAMVLSFDQILNSPDETAPRKILGFIREAGAPRQALFGLNEFSYNKKEMSDDLRGELKAVIALCDITRRTEK